MNRIALLRALARLATHYPRAVLAVASALTVLALLPVVTTGYSNAFNLARILPDDVPVARAFNRALTDFGSTDVALAVFHLDPQAPSDSLAIAGPWAERAAARLRAQPTLFKSATCRWVTPEEREHLLQDVLPESGLLLMPPATIDRAGALLEPDTIMRSLRKTEDKLNSIGGANPSRRDLLLYNMLGLADLFRDGLEGLLADGGSTPGASTKESDPPTSERGGQDDDGDGATGPEPAIAFDTGGYLVGRERRMLLLKAEPQLVAQDIRFAKRVMEAMERAVEEVAAGATPLRPEDIPDPKAFLRAGLAARPDTAEDDSPDAPATTETERAALAALFAGLPDEGIEAARAYLREGDPESKRLPLILRFLNEHLRGEAFPAALVDHGFAPSGGETRALLHQFQAWRGWPTWLPTPGRSAEPRLTEAERLRLNRKLLEEALPSLVAEAPWDGYSPAARTRVPGVEYGGGYQVARRYAVHVNSTLAWTLGISLVGVILLFGYAFRRAGVLLYIGLPLGMILAWTAGIGWLALGQLNLVSASFAAVLIGLGIDYAVHVYNRYIEARLAGEELEAAFTVALCHTGWGVIIGMGTTCAAFLALYATRFRLLGEFGLLAGLGISLAAPAMLLVLPALITLVDRRRALAATPASAVDTAASATAGPAPAPRPLAFGLPWIAARVAAQPRRIALGTLIAVVVAVGILALRPPRFDTGLAAIRPRDRAFELNREIANAFSRQNPNKLYMLTQAEGETPQAAEASAMAEMAGWERKLDRLQAEGLIAGYDSVTRFLPPPARQAERLRRIAAIDFAAARATLDQVFDAEFKAEPPIAFHYRFLKAHEALAARVAEVESETAAEGLPPEGAAPEGTAPEGRTAEADAADAGGLRALALLPSRFQGTPLARLVDVFVARRRRIYYLIMGLPPTEAFPVTLAKPALTRDDGDVRVPAGATLTRREVEALIDPALPEGRRVKSITVYEPGVTLRTTVYLPIDPASPQGAAKIDQDWVDRVDAILGTESGVALDQRIGDEPAAALTGGPLLAHELGKVVKADFKKVSIWIVVIALATLLAFYGRRPLRALYCFIPVGLGLLFLFALMGLLGMRFNFVNVLAVPIVIGVGVDNGIHLVNRFFEEGRSVHGMIADTGRALTITALTSMWGFGSLYLGGYGGLASLGVVSVLALGLVLAASLVCYPAIMAALYPPESPAPQQAD